MTEASLRLVSAQERDHDDLKDHAHRLKELEKRPGQWMDKVIAAAISSGVSAAVAFIVSSM